MCSSRLALSFVVVASILVAPTNSRLSAARSQATPAAPAALFRDVVVARAAVGGASPADRTVMRSRRVAVEFALLARASGNAPTTSDGTALLLNLFDDVSFNAVLDRVDVRANGIVWNGHIPGVEMSTVTLSTVDGAMSGSVATPGATYAIRFVEPGLHEISQIDQSRFLPELPPRKPVVQDVPDAGAAQSTATDSGGRIDVMVLFTPAATAAQGGAGAMQSLVNLAVSETNTSYANSGVTQRLNLVYSGEVSYTEHDDLGTDLDAVANNGTTTAIGNTAASLRNAYAADLVMLITAPSSPNTCGIAWKMDNVSISFAPYAFAVVERSCVSPNYSFAHELGHNMGVNHDWYVDNSTTPYTYTHGFAYPSGGWRTIMAYNNVCSAQSKYCTRLLYWANPSLTYGGVAMGIAGGTKSNCPTGDASNISCDADAHRALNETASTVANFRAQLTAPVITTNPANQTVTLGSSATFNAAASGWTSMSWEQSTDGGHTWAAVGVTTSPLTFTPALEASGKWYRAQFTNGIGTTPTSGAWLIVRTPFTDDPLAQGMAVKAAHVTELRARINALRIRYGMSPYSWTAGILTVGQTAVTKVHIDELRTALTEVYTTASLTPPNFTDAPLIARSTRVRAVHITELRTAVRALE
jgi:peptidyl-Asp metalloendopeptidase